jgi:hypothetical protein
LTLTRVDRSKVDVDVDVVDGLGHGDQTVNAHTSEISVHGMEAAENTPTKDIHMQLRASLILSITLFTTVAQAQTTPIEAFCAMLFACGREPDAAACVTAAEDSDERARAVGDDVCSQYADAELEWMACMGELDTIDSACPAEDAVRNDLEEQGASACGNGDLPLPPPNEWTCDPGFFNAADGCDCGCGAADFDCGDAGCTGGNCVADGCQWCHDDDGGDLAFCGGPPVDDGEGATEGEGESAGEDVPGAGVPLNPGGNCGSSPALLIAGVVLLRRRRRA